MTEEQIALARRAVACKVWRWMPGMLTLDDERMSDEGWPTYDVLEYGASGVAERVEWDKNPKKGAIPDLTDPATLGCLLALVREAWGDPKAYVRAGRGWEWVSNFYVERRPPCGETEAEALVAALEAAPKRGEHRREEGP